MAAAADDVSEDRGGFGSLGTALGALIVLWGALIGSFPLNDNSFFTHLATGRLILDQGAVPTSDPYTYSATGADWTVQSWLPSVLYAGAERIGGTVGVRLLVLALLVAAAIVVWRLSRPAESVVVRLLIAAGAMFVATGLWGERPYMVGVIGLGVVWLALEGTVRSWLLVPLLWLWGNSHGSYPLAVVLILLVLVGEVLDRRKAGLEVSRVAVATELRVLAMTGLGIVVAAVGPLGLEVFTFPFKALSQSAVLAEIVEWQPPQYESLSERTFLGLAALTFLALVRRGSWRLAIPAVAFAASAFFAQRNIVMATIVLVAVLARCAPRIGTLTSEDRPGLGPVFSGVCVGVAVLFSIAAVAAPAPGFGGYPAQHVAWLGPLDPQGPRLMNDVATGNLLEVLDGPTRTVFIDDRADMFPEGVFGDHIELLEGGPRWQAILEEHDVDIVVWARERPLGSLLAASDRWQVVLSDLDWILVCRRGPACVQAGP